MKKAIVILSSISMIFCPVTLTAADLILTEAEVLVTDGKGTTRTATAKGKFLLSRTEMEDVSAVLGDAESLAKTLNMKNEYVNALQIQLRHSEAERNEIQTKCQRRLMWAVMSGSVGLVVGVLAGVFIPR